MTRVTLRPGSPATAQRLEQQAELQGLAQNELHRVRKAAENWRTGLAAILGLIASVTVVSGRDTITGLSFFRQALVGVALLTAILAASLGLFRALRAAYGLPKLTGIEHGVRMWKHQEAVQAVADLRFAIGATFLSIAAIVAAVGVTWYSPEVPPAVAEVTANDRTLCGELVTTKPGFVKLRLADETLAIFRTSSVQTISIKEEC